MLSDPTADPADRRPLDDELLGVLANSRRQTVVGQVQSASGHIGLVPLSQRVARHEDDLELKAGTVRDIAIALAHNHLPKLAAHGLIDYMHGQKRIEPGDRLEEFEGHIPVLPRERAS